MQGPVPRQPFPRAFRALATTIVPHAATLAEPEWAELESIISDALATRPAGMRRQLMLFIRALDVLPMARWGRPFRALDPERRTRFLRGVERSPLFIVRRGFWGLRTLVLMGYYGRPAVHRDIGYDARLRGWLEHPDATAAARRAAAAAADHSAAGYPVADDPAGAP
jgi:hypothetical protein